ncbi:helix-turn-helix domain-containing protein [Streptomyces sp. NPDC056464]|uniref:helix-turn-helix domain-containing protein n=1 Tax=Streptomyces sp. NPDC056464 TaxID=3345828 RepID=UPI0036C08FC6
MRERMPSIVKPRGSCLPGSPSSWPMTECSARSARTPGGAAPMTASARARPAAQLRALRRRTSLSPAGPAHRLPYGKSSRSRYLNGRAPVPRQAVEVLCRLAGEPRSGRSPCGNWPSGAAVRGSGVPATPRRPTRTGSGRSRRMPGGGRRRRRSPQGRPVVAACVGPRGRDCRCGGGGGEDGLAAGRGGVTR